MEQQGEKCKKRKLDINWKEVLPERNDEPLAELIVEKAEPPTSAPKSVHAMNDDSGSGEESERQMSNHELELKIARMKSFYETSRQRMPDKGEKFIAKLQRLEKEHERRRPCPADMVSLVRIHILFHFF